MKILFTGGGTGGHFYPIIAVANAVRQRVTDRKIIPPQLYYMAPSKYNPRAVFDSEMQFLQVPAGKMRRYFSVLNFLDIFKTIYGCLWALIQMYRIFPDVVFGKGGYASFPALFAAKILRIPVLIHESDSKPGRVNLWAGKFAKKIAVSYPEASKYFDQNRVALTGNPIRKEITEPLSNGAIEFLKLENNIPTILILGGSQGSKMINDIIIESAPELLNRYQIIHQTGKNNFEEMQNTMSVVLKDHQYSYRYHPYDFLNELALRMAAGTAEIVVSRAGSTIFEIAAWGLPSIIIPLPNSISHDQTANAFAYAKSGASVVIEENNLSAHVLIEEIDRIVNSPTIKQTMRQKAKDFSRLDSANIIADAILNIALEHYE